jgi:hypothetical protein
MPIAALPITLGSRVIRIDGCDFRALTVMGGTDCYIVAADREQGIECAAPAGCFLAVPAGWQDPPPLYISELRAIESSYSGPIPAATLAAAEARDATFSALTRKLDAAEAWLAWVQAHLHPLSPRRFEPHLLAARMAREAVLRDWLAAVEPSQSDLPTPAWAAE